MKRIAIITQGVALGNEKGYTRFRSIADILSNKEFEVDLITSTFQHWEKKQRNLELDELDKYKFGVQLIFEPGYQKNIDLRRIYSHSVLAKNLMLFLEKNRNYDLIYSEIPPNNVAKTLSKFCVKQRIPLVIDVNDLWPEAMRMVMDIPLLSNIAFRPLLRDAEYVYSNASGVIGTSDEYRDRPFKNNRREIPKETVYVGNDLDEFDSGVNEYSDKIVKKKNEFWVTYAGTLGESYDIKTMILAADILNRRGNANIKTVILGGGPKEIELKKMAKNKTGNIEFAGYMPYKKMAAYLSKSDIVVNSFVRKAPQSIVTKIGDYLASGKAMINTCSSIEFRNMVKKNQLGINIIAEDEVVLANAVQFLFENEDKRKIMGERARSIAEKEFDRKTSYLKIYQLVNKVLSKEEREIGNGAEYNCTGL